MDRRQVQWQHAFVVLVFAALAFTLARTPADADLWGHIRFGLDTLDTHGPVTTDVYSYLSEGRPWINHEWLAEAIFAAIYRGGGAGALNAFKLATVLALSALLYLGLVWRGVPPLAGALVLATGMTLVAPGIRPIRPQLFTYLLFAIELAILELLPATAPAVLWTVPLLFMVWANLHGGWIAGIGILLIWALTTPSDRRRWLIVGLSAASTLVTPYGVRLWSFIISAIPPRPDIAEWLPLDLLSPLGVAYALVAGFCAVVLVRRGTWFACLVCLATALLAVRAQRHLPLFAIAALMTVPIGSLFARTIADVSGPPPERGRPEGAVVGRSLAGAVLAASVCLIGPAVHRIGCIPVDPERFPVDTVAFLKDAHARGRLLVAYDWGEYAIWHLAPDVQISIDGRRETLYGEEVSRQHDRFENGADGWADLLGEGDPDFALIPRGRPAATLMETRATWHRVAEDQGSVLFARGTLSAGVTEGTRGPAVPGRCFP